MRIRFLSIVLGLGLAYSVSGTTMRLSARQDVVTDDSAARTPEQVAEAWKAWTALPAGPEKLRAGIRIAGRTGEAQRAVDLYDALTDSGTTRDPEALRLVALAAATKVSTATGVEARAIGCSNALVLDQNHGPCRRALAAMTASSSSAYEQALGACALAGAGVEPPIPIGRLTQNLPKGVRMAWAGNFPRLPVAERLALVEPLLSDPDVATRYQAVLTLSEVPGDEATSALRNVSPDGPLATAVAIALARHGDKFGLSALEELLPRMSPYEKSSAGRAWLDVGDERGVRLLQQLMESNTDLERVYAAAALGRISADSAYRVLAPILESGSAAVRPAALKAAGAIRMGTDRIVYRHLADDSFDSQALAIQAVADTLIVSESR